MTTEIKVWGIFVGMEEVVETRPPQTQVQEAPLVGCTRSQPIGGNQSNQVANRGHDDRKDDGG